jgi:hypothetical protein
MPHTVLANLAGLPSCAVRGGFDLLPTPARAVIPPGLLP